MKQDRVTIFAILSILIIQLGILLSNEFRFSRIEDKINLYFDTNCEEFLPDIPNVNQKLQEEKPVYKLNYF